MQVLRLKKELEDLLFSYKINNHTIGFVPTMGALHDGHASLVAKAIKENSITVVSIFINPTQFDNKEDLDKYPTNLDKDILLLKKLSDKILIFAPSASEVYNQNINSKEYSFNGLEKIMEGQFRPGHFNVVATIVELLLNSVKPTRAYFGEKDFQQLLIIKKLVEIKNIPTEIINCPIERETNGLARSSRNERLSKPTREMGGFILKTLKAAKSQFGTNNVQTIVAFVTTEFEKNALFELEYFQIVDENTLNPILEKQKNIKYRAFIAVYTEGIRLIDNIAL